MVTEAQVREALKSILKSPSPDAWAADFNFRDSELDSLDHANLALYLEEHFKLTISDADLPSLVSILAIVNYASRTRVSD